MNICSIGSHVLRSSFQRTLRRNCSSSASARVASGKSIKSFSKENDFDQEKEVPKIDSWSNIGSVKYEQFDPAGSKIIYDINEEDLGLVEPEAPIQKQDIKDFFTDERGKEGVYDIDELVKVLKMENAKDVQVIKVPPEYQFVNEMVVATADTQKHIDAIAMSVRRVYLKKRNKTDRALILEGRDTPWLACDLGNIALHIMSPAERKRVDLESLWINGPENDPQMQEITVEKSEDLFTLVETEEDGFQEEAPYDITKEYIHPFVIVSKNAELPDYSEVNDQNRNTYTATSLIEMQLRKHNGDLAPKYRGRFWK